MRHTTAYRLSSPRPSIGERAIVAAVYGLLGVSAFLGFVIVPGGGLLALLMILAACGWVLWVLLSAAGSLIKRLVVATAAVIGRRHAHEPGRVADSSRRSSPSFRQAELARSEV
jgi:fructose-specific phosphotransferase system IIC component